MSGTAARSARRAGLSTPDLAGRGKVETPCLRRKQLTSHEKDSTKYLVAGEGIEPPIPSA